MQGCRKLGVCLLLAAFAAPLHAETKVILGAQFWKMDGDGIVGNDDSPSRAQVDFEDQSQNTFFITFEHQLPLLPDVSFRTTELETRGQTLVMGFDFEGSTFNGPITTRVDFSRQDLILYYRLLSQRISLDLGVDIMKFDGLVQVNSDISASTERVDFEGYLPTFYLAMNVQLLAGLSIGAEASALAAGRHHFYDYQAQLQYKIIASPLGDVALALGYREIGVEVGDIQNVDNDLTFPGPFARLQVHF